MTTILPLLSQDDIFAAIANERERQDDMFKARNTHVSPTDFMWPAIAAEQIGKAFSTLQYINRAESPSSTLIQAYEVELIKVAASAIQAIERIQALKSLTK